MTQEELGIVWLCGCTELEKRECAALLRAAASPARLLEEYEKIAPTVINSPKARLYKERDARFAAASQLLKRLEREGCFPITVLDEDYPEALKNIASPPLLLYGKGDRSLLAKRKFCIVGSRVTPPWAESLGKAIAGELASRFCIVTGLAEGGDSAAIAGALPFKNLISVLPCGIFGCYPASHAGLKEQIAKSGLLLSEYPPDEAFGGRARPLGRRKERRAHHGELRGGIRPRRVRASLPPQRDARRGLQRPSEKGRFSRDGSGGHPFLLRLRNAKAGGEDGRKGAFPHPRRAARV